MHLFASISEGKHKFVLCLFPEHFFQEVTDVFFSLTPPARHKRGRTSHFRHQSTTTNHHCQPIQDADAEDRRHLPDHRPGRRLPHHGRPAVRRR